MVIGILVIGILVIGYWKKIEDRGQKIEWVGRIPDIRCRMPVVS